uniref:Uncharacterized protein n=1 Tax=viral metagenome TaxID=1070528 RepID=A0A6M3XUK7_9ZZZZ
MKVQFACNCLCPECGQPMLDNLAQKRMVCVEPGCPSNGKFYRLPEIEVEPIEVKDL